MKTKQPKKTAKRLHIDLTGPEGNVFYLLGLAKTLSAQHGCDWEKIKTEMMSSDYDNAVHVFETHFDKYVKLVA